MRLIKYFALNGLFAFSIYMGLFKNNENFTNIAVFIGWFTAITGLTLLLDPVREACKEKFLRPTVPRWLDIMIDFCIVVSFIYYGYIWLPFFYIIRMALYEGSMRIAIDKQ